MNILLRYKCTNCGKDLPEQSKPCPNCGSRIRKVYATFTKNIGIHDGVKIKAKDKTGKTTREYVYRRKLSEKGKEAREELDINKEGNWKFHNVEELDEKGDWVVVHHENEPLKKKKNS